MSHRRASRRRWRGRRAAAGAATWLFGTLLAWPGHAAPPQTVYRCGPDGRVYSQTPCADGRPVTVDDPRSASQQKAAKDLAARESKTAQQLAEERRQREAAAKADVAIGIKPDAPAASAPAKGKPKAASQPAANMSPPMRMPPAPAAPTR